MVRCCLPGTQWRNLQRMTFSCPWHCCFSPCDQDEPSATLRLCPRLSHGAVAPGGHQRWEAVSAEPPRAGDSGPWSEPGREKAGAGGPAAIRGSCICIRFKRDVERVGTWMTPGVSPEDRAGSARVPFVFTGPRRAGRACGRYSGVVKEKWRRNSC